MEPPVAQPGGELPLTQPGAAELLLAATYTDELGAPTTLELVPAGQAVHALIPMAVWKVPALQKMQAVMADPEEKLPLVQVVQMETPAAM